MVMSRNNLIGQQPNVENSRQNTTNTPHLVNLSE